jgi:hypothetical protein
VRQRSEGSQFEVSPSKKIVRPYLGKPFTKIELVEWLKVKALSSSPNTTKKKNQKVKHTVTKKATFYSFIYPRDLKNT